MSAIVSLKRSNRWMRLLGVIVAASLAAGTRVYAQDATRASDDASARARALQYAVDRDQADLEAARGKVADLTSAREAARRQVDELQKHSDQPPVDPRAERERALADQLAQQERVKSARESFDAAKAKIDKLHEEELAKFEQTGGFKSAFAEFDKARLALKGPTDAVLDELAKTREFQDAVAAARTAEEKERKLRAAPNADPKEVESAHAAYVAADNRVQDLEEKVLKADPKVVAARDAVDKARMILGPMRDEFEQEFQQNPVLASAMADARNAEAALNQALADQKRVDDRVAKHQSGDRADPGESQDLGLVRGSLEDARRKLDDINRDLDDANRALASAEGRLRDDQQAMTTPPRHRDELDGLSSPPTYVPADVARTPVLVDEPLPLSSPLVYSPLLALPCVPACPPAPAICYEPFWGDSFSLGFGFSLGFSSGWRGYHDGWRDSCYYRDREYGGYFERYSRGRGDYRDGYYGYRGGWRDGGRYDSGRYESRGFYDSHVSRRSLDGRDASSRYGDSRSSGRYDSSRYDSSRYSSGRYDSTSSSRGAYTRADASSYRGRVSGESSRYRGGGESTRSARTISRYAPSEASAGRSRSSSTGSSRSWYSPSSLRSAVTGAARPSFGSSYSHSRSSSRTRTSSSGRSASADHSSSRGSSSSRHTRH